MDGEKKSCRNCKYGYMDELKDIICVNGDSEYVSCWVEYEFCCIDYVREE